ncbi:MAG: TonB-dependent receptor [Desulfobulbaceae bacterium]|jgi:iron complex outermembrane receptor protein|nr:TonB-dependent receptor [Desulfobulbaceae bacterium]
MPNNKKKMYQAACALLGLAFGANLGLVPASAADQPATKEKVGVFTLGEIEVRAKAETQPNTAVDSLGVAEIRSFNRDTVGAAAAMLPGVTLSTTGARSEQTLYVRGFDIKHVPLFLDGIPIYVPYDGYPDLGRFTTFDISQLVVSKGFTSVLYGPNTMGGAINMVSRRPENAFEGDAGVGIASGDTYTAYANLGANQGKWYIQGGASYLDRDYIPLSDDFDSTPTQKGDHRDNSYSRDTKANIKLGLTPNDKDEYAFSYIYQHGKKGTPPYAGSDPSQMPRYWQWPTWDKQSYYFTSMTDFSKVYLKTRAYHDIFKNSIDAFDDDTYSTMNKKSSFKSWYDDYTDGASLEIGTPIIPNNLIKAAMHYKYDVHREHNLGAPIQRFTDKMISFGLEDTVTINEKFYSIAGISYDSIDTKDAQNNIDNNLVDFPMKSTSGVNPQLGFFYKLTETGIVHASAALKTRLPSIKDRYSYRMGSALPNPDLDPEKSVNYEIGYENRNLAGMLIKGTVFYNDVTDYIQQATVADPEAPGMTKFQNQNIGEVDLAGIELQAAGNITDFLELGIGYTYTHADNKTNDDKLTGIPAHKLTPYARYNIFYGLSAQVDADMYSDRYSSSNGSRKADGFITMNAKLDYDFAQGFTVEAGVSNVLDKNYELEEGWPEAGRMFFANLRYSF